MMRWTWLLPLALAACGDDDPIAEATPEAFAVTPTYHRDVKPLLEHTCVPCHDGNGLRSGGVELDRYVSAYSIRAKIGCVASAPELVQRFATVLKRFGSDAEPCATWSQASMPIGARPPLTPYEQVVLLRWIETGAPE